MLKLFRDEQLRNFMFILFLTVLIYVLSLLMTVYHQYNFIRSQNVWDQYVRRVDIIDSISEDINQITLCQKDPNSAISNNSNYALIVECNQYSFNLDSNLKLLPEFFNLDNKTRQNIAMILTRKNPQILDQQSVTLINQVLSQLENQLTASQKGIDYTHLVTS